MISKALHQQTFNSLFPGKNYPFSRCKEKVVLFGTGNFMRGFVSYFLDQAISQDHYDGLSVIVQSTENDTYKTINQQEGVFSHYISGIENGNFVQEFILNASISRALTSSLHWEELKKLFLNPDLEYVFSNTTEAGVVYSSEVLDFQKSPSNFPNRLTALLFLRFQEQLPPLTIIPCELLVNNGQVLLEICQRVALEQGLGEDFISYLKSKCVFCNTLVDRIVPGKPEKKWQEETESKFGFSDELAVASEPYALFCIQPLGETKENFPWAKGRKEIIVSDDISFYRERKLRLLNGTHTISVALGHLYGLKTVSEMTADPVMSTFLKKVMLDEIIPSMTSDKKVLEDFAFSVFDRFANPSIHHLLLSICLEYTAKMNSRNGATFENYYNKFQSFPKLMCLGFAAYIVFSKPAKNEGNHLVGYFGGNEYPIKDSQSALFMNYWSEYDGSLESCERVVSHFLSIEGLWNQAMKNEKVFIRTIAGFVFDLLQSDCKERIKQAVL